MKEALKRIKQLEAALGRKTLENEILKEAVDYGKSRKWIAHSPFLPGDHQLLNDIITIAKDLPTYSYRRVWATLKFQGVDGSPRIVNHKRVYRVMRDNNLRLFRHGGKRECSRRHNGKVAVPTSNTRWCSDGFELACDNGEKVRVAFALDCCDREVMSRVATTKGIDAGLVGDLMMQAVEYRFCAGSKAKNPIEWLSDNGTCYTAIETRTFAKHLGLKPVRTPVESPQSNGMAESFVKTFKRNYAGLANRPDSQTVMRELKLWFEHYNEEHPRSALGYVPPRRYREKQRLID